MSEPVITYEELVLWRNICEWMAAHGGYAAAEQLTYQFGPEVAPLVEYDRARRQVLWDEYKIQLVVWERETRRKGYWKLKGNWEFKIEFLEKVVLQGKHPDTLPKTWLKKWEQKQHKEALKQWHLSLNAKFAYLEVSLKDIETCLPASEGFTRQLVNRVRLNAVELREHLKEYREKFDELPQPKPTDVVLGMGDVTVSNYGKMQPKPTDAVLGDQR